MNEPRDPTLDHLCTRLYHSMREVIDARPPERGGMIPLSRTTLEFWADTVAAIRLLLDHPPPGHGPELAAAVGVVGFLGGLVLGWYSR